MTEYLQYFDYGKIFYPNGASEYQVLDHSIDSDVRDCAARYAWIVGNKINYQSPFFSKPGNISVALIPYDFRYAFIQMQSRSEGEYATHNGLPSRSYRPFLQTRITLLHPNQIADHFERALPLYSALLYTNRSNKSLVSDPYALKDYIQPGQIINVELPPVANNSIQVRPEIIKLVNAIAQRSRKSKDHLSILYSNPQFDWRSRLEILEQTQIVMWHEWGTFSFVLDDAIDTLVNLQFIDMTITNRVRSEESIELQHYEIGIPNSNLSLILDIDSEREKEPKNSPDFLAYLEWLNQFLGLWYRILQTTFSKITPDETDLSYWQKYSNSAEIIYEYVSKIEKRQVPFSEFDQIIRLELSLHATEGKGFGLYFRRLKDKYEDYSVAKRMFLRDKYDTLSDALGTGDFRSAASAISEIHPEDLDDDLRRNLLNKVENYASSKTPPLIQRYGNVSAPKKVYLGQEFGIKVELGTKPLLPSSPQIYLPVGTPENKSSVDVLISFDTDEFVSTGDRVREIQVDNLQASAPVLFRLRSLREGRKMIKIEFFHQGTYKGMAAVEIETTEKGPVRVNDRVDAAYAIDDIILNLVDTTRTDSPDLTIYLGKVKDKYEYRLYSNKKELGVKLVNVVGHVDFSKSDPKAYMESIYEELNRNIGSAQNENLFNDELNSIGTQLYDQLFSEELKNLWWSALREKVKSILIISDETWIPWELIKPYQKDSNGKVTEDDFLCEKYHLARWLQGKGSLTYQIDFRNLKLIITSAMKELEGGTEHFDLQGLRNINLEECPASLKEVFSLLTNGGFDALHIACHGEYNSSNPDYSVLVLDNGEKLQPRHVSGSKTIFGKTRPIVFLNACESGLSSPSLTGVGGWAPQFLGAGASAFIGTTWDVDNHSASPFARTFYENLIDGMTIGAAMQDARKKIKKRGDSSWLSYTIYANPESIAITSHQMELLLAANEISNRLLPYSGDHHG